MSIAEVRTGLASLRTQISSPQATLPIIRDCLREPLDFLNSTRKSTNVALKYLPIPNPSLQKYFLDRLLPGFQDFLLENIVENWLVIFDDAERKTIFDSYFVGLENGKEFNQIIAFYAVQRLVKIISNNTTPLHTHVITTVLRLLRTIFSRFTILNFLQVLQEDFDKSREKIRWLQYKDFIGLICSIPTRMGNLLSGNIPELFRSDVFITKLLEQSDEAITWYAKQDLTVNQAIWIGQCIGELYQKIGRLGYGKLFGASLYTHLRRNLQSSYSNNYRAIYEKVLVNMNELEIDKFMDSLLRSSVRQELGLEPPHERTSLETANISITRVAKFFHSFLRRFLFEQNLREDEMLCSMNIKFLFTEKYLVNRTFESEVLRAQICILSGYPDITPSTAKPLLNSTFKKLLKTWADPIFIRHGAMEQHLYITKAILISLGYYDQSEIEKLNVLSIFMPGVTRYLESTNTSIRKYGMVTAELFAKRISTNEAQSPKPLDFGLDESDPDVQMLRRLTEFPDGLIPERAELEDLQNTEEDLSSEKSASIEDNSDDEWDPDSADVLELITGSDSDEAEDDDDLEPYPMDSEDEDEGDGKSKLKKPKYLSECLSYLKADEEPDKIENGLDTAVEIILNATEHELSVYGQEFVRKLLRIQDTYELSGFEKNRTHALVTLIVMCPNVTNNYLIEQFYERDYSMSQRFLILNCLVLAAQELSQVTKTSVETDSSSKHDNTIEYGGEMLDSMIEDIQKIGIGNGKNRWASRRQEVERRRGPPSKNRFAQVAGRWFFFPLIHGVGASASDIFNILGHPVLLEKFVTTLATLLYLSVGTLDFSKMCREFWDFSKSLKYYSHEGVISGVIFGLLVIATVLPGNTLVQEYPRELSETKEWASELYNKIQNEKLKSQCLGLLMKYQQIVSEYQKELFIEAGIVM